MQNNPAFWGPKSRRATAAPPSAERETAPAAPGSSSEQAPPQKLSKGMIKRLERQEEMRRQHSGGGVAARDVPDGGAGCVWATRGQYVGAGLVALAEGTAGLLQGKRPGEGRAGGSY